MRAVLDTNIINSALFWAGQPQRVVDLAISQHFQAITSPELFAELEAVLANTFNVPQERIDQTLRDVLSYSEVVTPTEAIHIDIRDLTDLIVLTCAITGQADYIVTGDADLLELQQVQGIKILTVREFLQLSY